MRMKHEISLDGLKGIAAFIIAFVYHYQHFGVAGNVSPFYKFLCFSYTWGGVYGRSFFYVIWIWDDDGLQRAN